MNAEVYVSALSAFSAVRMWVSAGERLRRVHMRIDVGQRIADGQDFLGVLAGNLERKLCFERHDHLDQIKRIGVQVIREARAGNDLALIDSKLLGDDLLQAGFQFRRGHVDTPFNNLVEVGYRLQGTGYRG